MDNIEKTFNEKNSKNQEPSKGVRIAKIIAQSGFCSRREAEQLILEGRVQVNGKAIDHPALLITDQSIKIDGKLINAKQPTKLFLFYKPVGTICTNNDPENRQTIFDVLPKNLPRLISVGRLDFNTEGLLLLTTDGALARYIELPKSKWVRKYRVRVFGKLNHERLKALVKGITVEGIKYGSIKVEVESEKESNSWLSVSLTEGKNREIRKIMLHLGLQVSRLIRVSFGPFQLGEMRVGEIHEVSKKVLKNSVPIAIN
ncbi:MAG: pseudouridine synthase [Rickettsiales bacterium]